MNNTIIEQAIANIAATSEALEKYCTDQQGRCSPFAAYLLERMSWELHKQANDLAETNYFFHVS